MTEKQFYSFAFVIEASRDEKENLAKFWLKCFRLALACFPFLSLKMFRDGGFALCPKVDVSHASSPE
jgi:hypothetical protein